MSSTLRKNIEDFLSWRRIAMIGVSRNASDFSRGLYNELKGRGYDVVPVNPNLPDVDGERCYAHVSDIEPPVEGALLMTPAAETDKIVRDCVKAGVPRVWMYRGAGQGAVSPAAIRYCEDHHVAVIPGECPFMYLPRSGWVHGAHRFCRKLVGSFPM